MIKTIFLKFLFIFSFYIFSILTAFCSEVLNSFEPSLIYSNQNWHFLDYYDNDKRICYLFSKKIDSFTNDKKDRDAHIMVSFYNKIVQVSLYTGYNVKGESAVTVSLDGKIYIFKKNKQSSYLFLEKDYYDYKFLQDLKKTKSIYVFSESTEYKYAVDVYSFRGFEETYSKLLKECKIADILG